MIRVQRGDPPDGFSTRAEGWLETFRIRQLADPHLTLTRYWNEIRYQLVLDAETLKQRFLRKCVFCESDVEYCSSLEVEHFYPKSERAYGHRTFDWTNWLVSCSRCNRSKGKRLTVRDAQPELIDPCIEDPSEHLTFDYGMILSLTDRGRDAIRKVKLDRSPLVKARDRQLMWIDSLILLCFEVPQASADARDLLIWARQDEAPFAAMTRIYLRDLEADLNLPPVNHPRVQIEEPMQRIRALARHYREQGRRGQPK
jgi:uncharacterized protein (TIGR02646 family)